jgi:hypothetical protein
MILGGSPARLRIQDEDYEVNLLSFEARLSIISWSLLKRNVLEIELDRSFA